MAKIKVPRPQTESRFFSLPAEIRNEVYAYVFDDGRSVHLRFLLTCRFVYHEAGVAAFSSLAIKLAAPGDFHHHHLNWPYTFRRAVHTVCCESSRADFAYLPNTCNHQGLFPIQAVQLWYATRPNLLTSLGHIRRLLTQPMNTGWPQTPDPQGALFGQFLDNPRLRRWTLRIMYAGCTIHTRGQIYEEIVAVRENEDGTAISESVQLLGLEFQSAFTKSSAWCDGFEVELAEENGDQELVVKTQIVDGDGDVVVGPVRLRFKVVKYSDG